MGGVREDLYEGVSSPTSIIYWEDLENFFLDEILGSNSYIFILPILLQQLLQ